METLAGYNLEENLLNWDMTTGGSKNGMNHSAKMIGFFTIKSYEVLTGEEMTSCLELIGKNLENIDDNTRRIHEVVKRQYGSLETPEEILIRATGKRFDIKYCIDYLTNKYKSIYNL